MQQPRQHTTTTHSFLKRYYITHLDDILHTFTRSYLIAFLLLLIRLYWRVCLIKPSTSDINSEVSFSQLSLLSHIHSSLVYLYCILAINGTIVLLLTIDMTLKYFKQSPKTLAYLTQILSCLTQVYTYVFFIPGVYYSISYINTSTAISILTLTTTILIELFVVLHDQNWSFTHEDYLDRRNAFHWDILLIILEIASAVLLSQTTDHYSTSVLGILLSAFCLTMIYVNLPYSNKYLRIVETSNNFFCFFFSTFQLLQSLLELSLDEYEEFLVAIIAIPIAVKTAVVFLSQQPALSLDLLNAIVSKEEYTSTVDSVIRNIVSCEKYLEFENYSLWEHASTIEAIIVNHYSQCKRYPNCFCSLEIQGNEKSRDLMVSGKERLKYVVDFIEDKFTSILNHNKKKANQSINNTIELDHILHYSFFYFLLQKKHSKILAFTEIVRVLDSKNLSLRSEFFLTRILKQVKRVFAENQLESQLQHYDHDTSQANTFLLGIQFDERMNRFEDHFNEGIKQKLSYLSTISSDTFDLTTFEHNAVLFNHTRSVLQSQLIELFSINETNSRLRRFLENYLSLMSFLMRKSDFLSLLNMHSRSLTRLQRKTRSLLNKDHFASTNDICIMFISLLGRNGIIKRTQNSLHHFFGYTQQEALGKKIEFLMPDLVSQYHDHILRDFFYDKKQLKEYSDYDEGTIPLSLAKNRQGWAVPISLRLRSECFGMECGICAEIQLIRGDNSFVMTKGASFTHQISSEALFKNVFSKYFLQTDLNKIHLINVLPTLPTILREQCKNPFDWQRTIAILPRGVVPMNESNNNNVNVTSTPTNRLSRAQFFQDHLDKRFLNRIDSANALMHYCDIYEVCLKVYSNQNSYFKYNILQIATFQRICDYSQIHAEFQVFKQQYHLNAAKMHPHHLEAETDAPQQNTIVTFRSDLLMVNSLAVLDSPTTPRTTAVEGGLGAQDNNKFSRNKAVSIELVKISPQLKQRKVSENITLNNNFDPMTNSPNSIETRRNLDYIESMQSTRNVLSDACNSPHNDMLQSTQRLGRLSNRSLLCDQNGNVAQLPDGQSPGERRQTRFFSVKDPAQYRRKQSDCYSNGNMLSEDFDDPEGGNTQRNNRYTKNHIDDKDNEDSMDVRMSRQQSTSSQPTTKSHERKRIIRDHVLTHKPTMFLSILTGFGVVSLVSVLAVTLFQFISVRQNMNVIQLCSDFIPWPMNVRTELVSMLKQEGLLRLSSSGAFSSIDSDEFRAVQTQKAETAARALLDLYYKFLSADLVELTFLSFANSDVITFYETKDELVLADRETFNLTNKVSVEVQLTNVIPFYGVIYSQMPRKKPDDQIYTMMVLDNFPVLNPHLMVVQQKIMDLAYEKLDFIVEETTILLFLVIIVTLAFIGSIFPIYFYLQRQKERIYKLFATISNAHLKAMLHPVIAYLNQEKLTKSQAILEHYLKKKKAIAETNTLLKFKPGMVIYSFISFVVVIVQPITNQVLTSQFQDQSLSTMSLLRNIYGLKALFMSDLGLYYEFLYKEMDPGALFYYIDYYYNRFPVLAKQSESQVEEMYSFVSNAHSSTYFEKDLIDGFLFKILEGNMCEAIAEYPELVKAGNEIDDEICLSINSGVLKTGLEINAKSFIQVFANLLEIFNMEESAAKTAKLVEWEKEVDLNEFEEYTSILFKVFDIMKDFMLDILQRQMDQMMLIQDILVSFQIVSLIIVFSKGWIQFYVQIQREMLEARQLLSVLSIDVIIDNSYIQSYIAS